MSEPVIVYLAEGDEEQLSDLSEPVDFGGFIDGVPVTVRFMRPVTEPERSQLWAVEANCTPGAAQAAASQVLGREFGVSRSGRLGVELSMGEADAKRVGAELERRGHAVYVGPAYPRTAW